MESSEEKLRRLYGTAEFSRLQGALDTAFEDEGFVENLLLHDRVDDWRLVREIGQYLVLTSPDLLIGHVIVARASRHLGTHSETKAALRNCQELIHRGASSVMELNVLVPIIEAEERALADDTSPTGAGNQGGRDG
jgi:hypothetical protein